jgi:hypothetical protein
MGKESARGRWVLGDTERARSEWEFHASTPASKGGERSWNWAAGWARQSPWFRTGWRCYDR